MIILIIGSSHGVGLLKGLGVNGAGTGGKLGWWETDLDSSSDTLTPQRVQPDPGVGVVNPGVKPGQAVAKPLLPFSVTPPKPSG